MRFKTALTFIFFLLLLITTVNCEVTFIDLSKDQNKIKRVDFIQNNVKQGLRIHTGGIKVGNKYVGAGNVNVGTALFQKELITSMNELQSKSKNITNIMVRKTDFKGYYITCNPMPSCLKTVTNYSDKKLPKKIVIKNKKTGVTGQLRVNVAEGENFTKSYMKARFMDSFEDYKPGTNLDEFVKSKTEEVKKLFKNKKINMYKLKELLAVYRGESIDKIEDINYKKAILLLDALEVPFATASNLEESLYKIISNTRGTRRLKNGITLSKAFSGDDLFIVIKDTVGNNIDLIGADARGLGITNMITRFNELIKPGANSSSMDDVIELSLRAIDSADKQMFESMDAYIYLMSVQMERGLSDVDLNSIPRNELQKKLLEILKNANMEYNKVASLNPHLMNMRAARIDPKNIRTIDNIREIMDTITELHNEAKRLEKSDIIKLITVDDLIEYKLQSLRLINCLKSIKQNM